MKYKLFCLQNGSRMVFYKKNMECLNLSPENNVQIITFPKFIYGFEDTLQYYLKPMDKPHFFFLTSVSNIKIKFVLNHIISSEFEKLYKVKKDVIVQISNFLDVDDDLDIYLMTTLSNLGGYKLNYRAPLLISNKKCNGWQIILDV